MGKPFASLCQRHSKSSSIAAVNHIQTHEGFDESVEYLFGRQLVRRKQQRILFR